MATTTGASTATSVLDGWKAQGIRFVRFELPDMHGTSRTKMVPIERAYGYAESGLNMYGGVAVLDSRSDVVGGTLYNEEIAYGDQLLIPDPSTAAVVPWAERHGSLDLRLAVGGRVAPRGAAAAGVPPAAGAGERARL